MHRKVRFAETGLVQQVCITPERKTTYFAICVFNSSLVSELLGSSTARGLEGFQAITMRLRYNQLTASLDLRTAGLQIIKYLIAT
jgi:hypothetical protein